MKSDKKAIHDFWQKASCGETLYLAHQSKEAYLEPGKIHYHLKPFILYCVDFERSKGKKVLEIGVDLGADHQKVAEAGAILWGVDLTDRAIAQAPRLVSDLKAWV